MTIKSIGGGYVKITPDAGKRLKLPGDEKSYKTAIVKSGDVLKIYETPDEE